jgi:hypothetical protein
MRIVISVDLDFFFTPTLRSIFSVPLDFRDQRQQANSKQDLWMEERIIEDLISYFKRVRKCSSFHCVEKHNESLYHICEAIEADCLQTPMTILNFDAHSDLYWVHDDSHYEGLDSKSCELLSITAEESDWIWVLHAIDVLDKYIWIKPDPKFLSFALPELPKSLVKPNSPGVLQWLENNRQGYTWSDAMWDGTNPKLLKESFKDLRVERFGRSFGMEVQRLQVSKLPQSDDVSCIILCRSPGYTASKADNLYDKIIRDSTP